MSRAARCLADGGVPYREDSLVHNEESIMSMVAAGIGLYPAATWYRHAFAENVRCIPLKVDVVKMKIVLAWRKRELDEKASVMAEITQRMFEKMDLADVQ